MWSNLTRFKQVVVLVVVEVVVMMVVVHLVVSYNVAFHAGHPAHGLQVF